MTVSRPAPAKINLFLEVGPRIESGRHLINSLLLPISLSDTVSVEKSATFGCHVELANSLQRVSGKLSEEIVSELNSESNLAMKAAQLFLSGIASAEKVQIRIEKQIPLQAGLGGGSSDAAATLSALNQLFNRPFEPEALVALAGHIGSDVPGLLLGGPAVLTGTGEDVIRCTVNAEIQRFDLLLVKPPEGVATKDAYEALGRLQTTDSNKLRLRFATNRGWVSALDALGVSLQTSSTTSRNLLTLKGELGNSARASRGSAELLEKGIGNDFDAAVGRAKWFIDGTAALQSAGASKVLLCGSGSCLCGFMPPLINSVEAEQNLRGVLQDWWIARAKALPGAENI